MRSNAFIKLFSDFSAIFIFVITIFSACKKEENKEEHLIIGTVTDFENNVYQTVKIGNQWWMTENLRSKFYNNGIPITRIQQDSSGWSNDTVGCYCIYNDNASSP